MSLTRSTRSFMLCLSPACRARRPGEWSPPKAVTFIVTLAANRSVTLAARAAGMSRKSAYKLKSRDRAFSDLAQRAERARFGRQGDEVEEVEDLPIRLSEGDNSRAAAPSTSSTRQRRDRARDNTARDLFFARLAAKHPRLAATHHAPPPAAADLLPSRKPLSL